MVPHERYFEPFQILRYEPGQFYRVHHDQNCGLFTPQGSRVYTFFMYLSTPERGGGGAGAVRRRPSTSLVVVSCEGRRCCASLSCARRRPCSRMRSM
mmetsp:Transcript_8779/g.29283  ORF Transcript_8779/g.29283 Transcript_8779/m.29283 type:complete len:97 (-) Transcript_8779:115-405(-)